jgi:hypothetical protein
MNPRKVKLFDRISRIVAGNLSVPSPGPVPLYCAISPDTGMRAYLLRSGSIACQTAPPTFSK